MAIVIGHNQPYPTAQPHEDGGLLRRAGAKDLIVFNFGLG